MGEFEKNGARSVDDVKGTLDAVRFYEGGVLARSYDFSDSPLDARNALDGWRGLGHHRNNYVELAASLPQSDTVSTGAGRDIVIGGGGADVVWLGAGADEGHGGSGADTVLGNGGSDRLSGDAGNDLIGGGAGRDILGGGRGHDTLRGQGGRDVFLFGADGGRDAIRDLVDDVDTVRLDSGLWSGDRTARQVVNGFGRLVDQGTSAMLVFDDGERLLLRGVSDLASLYDDIQII